MLSFILTLLALVLSIGAVQNPQVSPEEIIAQIEEKITPVFGEQHPGNLPDAVPPVSTPSASLESSHEEPNTQKDLTYNLEAERFIGEVPQVAIENARPLVPCEDFPELCAEAPSPTPTPTPTPTPPPLPDPEPIPDPINPLPCLPEPGVRPPLHPLIECLGI